MRLDRAEDAGVEPGPRPGQHELRGARRPRQPAPHCKRLIWIDEGVGQLADVLFCHPPQRREAPTDAKGAATERTVHPLGLVSKGTTWYLVADTENGRRTFRVWRVRSVDLTDEPAARPPDFNLHRAWNDIVASLDERRGLRHVEALADPGIVRWLRLQFGTRVTIGTANDDGRLNVDIGFPPTHDDPARELCGFAGGLEVTGPADVRARLAEIGSILMTRHGASPASA